MAQITGAGGDNNFNQGFPVDEALPVLLESNLSSRLGPIRRKPGVEVEILSCYSQGGLNSKGKMWIVRVNLRLNMLDQLLPLVTPVPAC